MKKCAIVGAGEFAAARFNKGSYDFIIAADGGYEALLQIGVTPDVLIGDMDSLSVHLPSAVKTVRHPVKKDKTDMQLALEYAEKLGYTDFDIYGGTGGRQDHTFANYCLQYGAKLRGLNTKLISRDCYSLMVKDETVQLCGRVGAGASVFAFGDGATVSIRGLLYEGESIRLTPDFALGVSNSFKEEQAELNVLGAVLVIIEF